MLMIRYNPVVSPITTVTVEGSTIMQNVHPATKKRIRSANYLGRGGAISLLVVLVCSLTLTCSIKRGTPAGSSIDAEAREEAEEFWNSQITKCDDSYYRKQVLVKKDNYEVYYQMKEPSVKVLPIKLTEADQLNGIEWRGTIAFQPKASRVWSSERKMWTEWLKGSMEVPELSYSMQKANGRWSVNTKRDWTLEQTSKYVPIDCSKIPPG